MQQLQATTSDELTTIEDLLHDAWFSTDEIDVDSRNRTMRLFFEVEDMERAVPLRLHVGRVSRMSIPIVRVALRIDSVVDYQVTDETGTGRGDLNEIRYFPNSGTLAISAGSPISVVLKTEGLHVAVETTRETGRTVEGWRWLDKRLP